jgi:hypothetical protein
MAIAIEEVVLIFSDGSKKTTGLWRVQPKQIKTTKDKQINFFTTFPQAL